MHMQFGNGAVSAQDPVTQEMVPALQTLLNEIQFRAGKLKMNVLEFVSNPQLLGEVLQGFMQDNRLVAVRDAMEIGYTAMVQSEMKQRVEKTFVAAQREKLQQNNNSNNNNNASSSSSSSSSNTKMVATMK
jgi:hypothetical protein